MLRCTVEIITTVLEKQNDDTSVFINIDRTVNAYTYVLQIVDICITLSVSSYAYRI